MVKSEPMFSLELRTQFLNDFRLNLNFPYPVLIVPKKQTSLFAKANFIITYEHQPSF